MQNGRTHPLPTAQQAPTGSDMKYRNMMAQAEAMAPPPPSTSSSPSANSITAKQWSDDEILAYTSNVKRQILLNWGLVPPNYQVLKSIDDLLCQIQSVFPPAFHVEGHSYFQTWRPILSKDLQDDASLQSQADSLLAMPTLDPDKLKKAVRKLRFFLHPDKLPKDLDPIQEFVCKLLWDVTSDAYEDYKEKLQKS